MPDFPEWLTQYTTNLVNAHGSHNVDIDLLRLSALPAKEAETYQQMWAYGNHYRVANEEDELGFVTQDYGIASIFGAEEGRSAGVTMVGVLKEIIVVRYSAQRRVVFRGSWIRNDPGPRTSTKVDQYGFTVVRFADQIARDREPYVLPATVRQVLQCQTIHILYVQHHGVASCLFTLRTSHLNKCFGYCLSLLHDSDVTRKYSCRSSLSKIGCIPIGVWCFRRSRGQGECWITTTNKYWGYPGI